jgi:hypothetical protein
MTVTIHLAGGAVTIKGPLLLHEECGGLVAPAGVGAHERLDYPEAAEEGR